MATSQPTRSVAIGRYALAVGAPAGTLISAGPLISADTAVEAPAELTEALAHEADERQTTAERAEGALVSAEEATKRVEQADDLLRAALDGSLLDRDDLLARAGVMLDVLQRLDRDGRWEEWLRFARAINGLLALAMRWAELVRSLGATLRAAERVPDLAAAVAWAQHELGTLHLAVEDAAGAERRLAKAREIRQRLGDREGLAVTEQSLSVLCRQQVRAGRLQRSRGRGRRLLLTVIAVLLLLVGGVAGAVVDPFDPGNGARLSVRVEGRGAVTSTPAGISCPGRCDAEFASRRSVSLIAAARPGATFAGWSGDCQGVRRCRVRVDDARTVTARFAPATQARTVIVRRAGDGEGRVTSPPGIDCPGACRTSVERGSRIRLLATPVADATFAGWSGGGCAGTDPCALTVDEPVTITARFAAMAPGEASLTVIPAGEGSGIVTSIPQGISCGQDCTRPFPQGRAVLLTHAADDGSDFAGWSGAGCSGTDDCTVTLSQPQMVTATFDLEPTVDFTLTTSTSGSGSITAISGSDTAGRGCTPGCAFPQGTVVTLTAAFGPGANTVRWTGCEPADDPATCDVTMSEDRALSASFTSVVE